MRAVLAARDGGMTLDRGRSIRSDEHEICDADDVEMVKWNGNASNACMWVRRPDDDMAYTLLLSDCICEPN